MKHLCYILLTLFLMSCASNIQSNNRTRIDNIPMYGQPEIKRPDYVKKADEKFIQEVINAYGTRTNGSKAWYAQGEKFMHAGNLDYAMRRYNQSWLLNPDNYQPYWGFARVLMEKNKIDEAIKFLEKSESLINDTYQEVALLSDLGVVYSHKAKKNTDYFNKANAAFIKSTTMDPTYPGSWMRWAYSLYQEGKYADSWEKVIKYEKLTSKPFPSKLTNDLIKKAPKPLNN